MIVTGVRCTYCGKLVALDLEGTLTFVCRSCKNTVVIKR